MFNNMEYVYEVYRQKSFSKAAAALYISQPALSATIKKIEEKIGVQLFDRSTSPIQLTECGEKYIACVEEIRKVQSGFESYLRDLDEMRAGKITIGGSNFFSSFMLPPILEKFKKKYPQITIQLIEADTGHLEKQLAAGNIDLMIDNYPFSKATYHKRLFYGETLVLAVPKPFMRKEVKGIALTAKQIEQGVHLEKQTPCVALSVFQDASFVFLKTGNDTRLKADKICADYKFTPQITLELDQLATAYNICYQGIGITIVSDTLVKKAEYSKDMYYFKLNSKHTRRENFFYYKKNKQLTKSMEELLHIACEENKIK